MFGDHVVLGRHAAFNFGTSHQWPVRDPAAAGVLKHCNQQGLQMANRSRPAGAIMGRPGDAHAGRCSCHGRRLTAARRVLLAAQLATKRLPCGITSLTVCTALCPESSFHTCAR